MVALRYRIAGRAMRLWWRVARPRTFGVRALLTDPAGRIADGGVDKRESAEDAIRRELIEEVGLADVAIAGLLGVYHNRSQAKDDHVVVFVAHVADPATLRAADPREIAEASWFAPDGLPEGTSPATRRRIAEHRAGRQGHGAW